MFDTYNTETKKLLICCCTSWARDEEISIRSKSVEIICRFTHEIEDSKLCQFYKKKVLDNVVRYLTLHFGKEGQIKAALEILKSNVAVAKRFTDIFIVPYGDLEPLISNDKEQDFFDLVLNLKLTKRARGIRTISKAIEAGFKFESGTIRNVFKGLLEYLVFDYWRETTNPSNSYSSERIDRVRNVLLEAFAVYGKLVGMLSLPQYIKYLRELIKSMTHAGRSSDNVLKLICCCLENIDPSLHDVLTVINEEHAEKNRQEIQNSYINQILSTFSD